VNFGIPSGQALGKEHAALVLHFEGSGAYGAGLRLGPVGALIVNEVFIGLLKADESSYLATQPRWIPVLRLPHQASVTSLLTFEKRRLTTTTVLRNR
jgi:hypothetical protein